MKLKKPDRLFGVKLKTKKQKRFMKWFIVLKSLIYIAIFILMIVFLVKLKNFGN